MRESTLLLHNVYKIFLSAISLQWNAGKRGKCHDNPKNEVVNFFSQKNTSSALIMLVEEYCEGHVNNTNEMSAFPLFVLPHLEASFMRVATNGGIIFDKGHASGGNMIKWYEVAC